MKIPPTMLIAINNFIKHTMSQDKDAVTQRAASLYLGMNKESLHMGELKPETVSKLNAMNQVRSGNGLEISFKDQNGVEHIGVIL